MRKAGNQLPGGSPQTPDCKGPYAEHPFQPVFHSHLLPVHRQNKKGTCRYRLMRYWEDTKQARIAASKTTGWAALIGGAILFASAGAFALSIMLTAASPSLVLAVIAGFSLTTPLASGLSFAVAAAMLALVCLATYAGVHASKVSKSQQAYRKKRTLGGEYGDVEMTPIKRKP